MNLIQWVDLKILGDDRGSLIALEAEKNVPETLTKKPKKYIESKKQLDINKTLNSIHFLKNITKFKIIIAGKRIIFPIKSNANAKLYTNIKPHSLLIIRIFKLF